MDVRITHYSRYVTLHSSAIFASLVSLFTPLLRTHWQYFKAFAKIFPPPQGLSTHVYAARVYISHWFLDLYVSNREATREMSPLAFAQHFEHDLVHFSTEYDRYLTLLNAAIRPTHITGALEDAIYIPLLSNSINWDSDNPFGIDGFSLNFDYFMGIIDIMKRLKNWKMSTLATDTLGRPSWLFDWHDEACCAWFPAQGNYSKEDVTIAYIIGEACSSNMGPRDVDDWTYFEEGMSHTNFDVEALSRCVKRRFYGSYEITTVEVRASKYPEVSSSATTSIDPVRDMIKSCHQYQITNWTYYARVTLKFEFYSKSSALWSIVMGELGHVM